MTKPPTNKTKKPPAYLFHRASGHARVRILGQDVYLGKYGSTKSKEKYAVVLAEYAATGAAPRDDTPTTIAEIAVRFLADADHRYRKNGRRTSEFSNMQYAAEVLVETFGPLPAADFTPRALRIVRQAMIDRRWSRKSINRMTSRVRRIFRWGVAEGLVDAGVWQALSALDGLRRGADGVVDRPRIRPVPPPAIDAIQPHVAPPVWAMVELQRLTGMRSGEVVIMRGVDLDVSGDVWLYRPASHKTEHHDIERIVEIGPRGQIVVSRFLCGDPNQYLFRPPGGQGARGGVHYREKTAGGVSGRRVGDRYTPGSYRRSISRACKLAGIDGWTPHRLRHTFATEVRRLFGVEVARVMLGHRSAITTEIYAEADRQAASKAALAAF
ncbi:MAG: site-specific integrase [Phycisphaerae bacterium]|jgi:integrase|nr:site-specific integrase [Phycisphaerae bacterium]